MGPEVLWSKGSGGQAGRDRLSENGNTYKTRKRGVAVYGHGAPKRYVTLVKLSTIYVHIIQQSAIVCVVSTRNVQYTRSLPAV